jgi:uncharacterized membrane protein YkoI
MGSFFGRALEPALKGAFICGSCTSADNQSVKTLRNATPVPSRTAAAAAVRLAIVAVLLCAGISRMAWADGRDDHERARAAVQAGEVMPLASLLERLQRTHPGQVLELELDRQDGRWIYEVKLLQPNGRLLKLELDARTAQVLEARHKDERSAQPPKEPSR